MYQFPCCCWPNVSNRNQESTTVRNQYDLFRVTLTQLTDNHVSSSPHVDQSSPILFAQALTRWWNPRLLLCIQHHIKAVSLATDSESTSNMSISDQDEHGVSLKDDCPDYNAVVDRRQEAFPWQLPISSAQGEYKGVPASKKKTLDYIIRNMSK